MRDVGRRLQRWSSLALVVVLAVPELTWAWDPLFFDDSPIRGGVGLISQVEGVWIVVVVAAAVPASMVVADRRDGLVLLLRLRGLGPVGYLALRASVAGLVASTLAMAGLLLSLFGLVVLVGPEAAGYAPRVLPEAPPLLADVYTIIVVGAAAGGLAALSAVVGSVVQVPIVPNLVPLAGFVGAAWLESMLPAPVSEVARAAAAQPDLSLGHSALEVVVALLVWPAVAALSILLVGPRQESLWRR